MSLPYYGRCADEFKEKVTKLVTNNFPKVELRVAFKSPATIDGVFSFKDKTPKQLLHNVVYLLSCKDCNSRYIGKTSRNICTRFAEHQTSKPNNQSSVLKHAQETGHSIDWENWKILDRANRDQKLLLKEMLHIYKHKPELNIQEHSELFCLLIGKNKVSTG